MYRSSSFCHVFVIFLLHKKIFYISVMPLFLCTQYQGAHVKSRGRFKLSCPKTCQMCSVVMSDIPSGNVRYVEWQCLICLEVMSLMLSLSIRYAQHAQACSQICTIVHRISNRNTVKISYRCIQNINQIISNHNIAILTPKSKTEKYSNNCNCRVKEACPVDEK